MPVSNSVVNKFIWVRGGLISGVIVAGSSASALLLRVGNDPLFGTVLITGMAIEAASVLYLRRLRRESPVEMAEIDSMARASVADLQSK